MEPFFSWNVAVPPGTQEPWVPGPAASAGLIPPTSSTAGQRKERRNQASAGRPWRRLAVRLNPSSSVTRCSICAT